MRRSIVFIALGILISIRAVGEVRVRSMVSRDSALLGDTVRYSVEASGGGGAEVFFIAMPDTLVGGGELWQAPRIDTLEDSREGITLRLQMVVTSYDSGEVVLPRFGVLIRHAGVLDTLYSDSCRLFFSPVPREAGGEEIKDIRGPLAQRLTFWEVFPWLLGAIILLAAIAGIVLYRRYLRSGQIVGSRRRLVPPDELALDRLRRLREEKTWRVRGVKVFYTEISDTLREFLSSEFGVRAMECTSSKIVQDLRSDARCGREWIRSIEEVLQLSDLTKFARFTPSEQDCLYTIGAVETLVREVHAELHAEEETKEEEVDGPESAPDRHEEAEASPAAEAEKERRDAERFGPRSGGGARGSISEGRAE